MGFFEVSLNYIRYKAIKHERQITLYFVLQVNDCLMFQPRMFTFQNVFYEHYRHSVSIIEPQILKELCRVIEMS